MRTPAATSRPVAAGEATRASGAPTRRKLVLNIASLAPSPTELPEEESDGEQLPAAFVHKTAVTGEAAAPPAKRTADTCEGRAAKKTPVAAAAAIPQLAAVAAAPQTTGKRKFQASACSGTATQTTASLALGHSEKTAAR